MKWFVLADIFLHFKVFSHERGSSTQSLFERMASELEGEDIEIKISKCLDVLKEAIVSSVSDEIERSRLAYEQTATELQVSF